MDAFPVVVFQAGVFQAVVIQADEFRHPVDFRHRVRAVSAVVKDGPLPDGCRLRVGFQRRDDCRSQDG